MRSAPERPIESTQRRFLSKIAGGGAAGALNFLFQILLGRLLGPAAYGRFFFIQNHFESIFQGLDLGASTSYFTLISQDKKFYPSASGLMLLIFGVILFGVFAYIALTYQLNLSNFLWPDIPMPEVICGMFLGLSFWLSRVSVVVSDSAGFSQFVESIRFLRAALAICLVLTLLFLGVNSVSLILFASGCLYFAFAIFCVVYGHLKIKEPLPAFQWSKIKYSFSRFKAHWGPLLYYGVFSTLILLFERWLLQYAAGSEQQGYWALAMQIAMGIYFITHVMTPVIQRETAVAFGKNDFLRMRMLFSDYSSKFFLFACVPSIFLVFYSQAFAETLLGRSLEQGKYVFLVMAMYPIHAATGRLALAIHFSTNRTRTYMWIGFFRDLVGLSLALLLIAPKSWWVGGFALGGVGLALKMVFSQLLNTMLLNWSNCRFLGLNFRLFLATEIRVLITVSLCGGLSWLLTSQIPVDQFQRLVLGSLCYASQLLGLAYFFPWVLGLSRKEIDTWLVRIKPYRLGFTRM